MAQNTKVAADHNAPPITRILAEFVVNHPSRGWSDAVEHEAHRTFLNWFGCAIGAATHPAMDAALGAMMELSPAPQASILGRKEKVDITSAALLNGIASHTFDFDDTHLKTIIHPAGPVASALLALAEKTGASGREIIDAMVLGIDVSCRIGNMMYPDHYDRGWHITGSTGSIGAAAACARLMKLDVQKTMMAIGIAASQPIGMREQFGTMIVSSICVIESSFIGSVDAFRHQSRAIVRLRGAGDGEHGAMLSNGIRCPVNYGSCIVYEVIFYSLRCVK